MARLVALGVAVVVVAFGAAFGISRAASGGSTAHAAKPPATVSRAPARDTALAASFSGQLVSLKLPAARKHHAGKRRKHHAVAKDPAKSSSGSSTSSPSTSAPSTSAPSASSPSTSSPPAEVSPAMPSIGSSGGGSSGATHHSSHHHSGTGSGTITIG